MNDERRAWSLRIDEATNVNELAAIGDQIKVLAPVLAGPLRIKIISRKIELRKQATVIRGGYAFAAIYGLPAPDGRRLHSYRLSDQSFRQLQDDLLQKRNYAALSVGYNPGFFVLWASEWFRRCYRGDGHRWVALAEALALVYEYESLVDLTRSGLKLWGRTVIRTDAGNRYLASLAREGGFPAAAVEDGGRGWAKELLGAIIGPLLGEPAAGEERARELAEAQRSRLPKTFDDQEFIQLCADLALAIVVLRREVEPLAAAEGLPISAWLALNRPDWRATLPLTTGDRVAEALLESLLKVEVITGATVGVERLLWCQTDGTWLEAARVFLDGAVDSATMRGLSLAQGRLRAFASGPLGRFLPGELALFDPPVDGDKVWEARANRRAQGVHLVPFGVAIELELRAGQRNVASIALSGGKPRRGDLLVAQLEGGSEDQPEILRIVGSGSGQYRAKLLFVQAPMAWKVFATTGEEAEFLGPGARDTQLWRVRGGCSVTDESGDIYRIRCNQAQDAANRIELIGNLADWCEVSGNIDLYSGPPLTSNRGHEGQLFLRTIGERIWRTAPSRLPVGHYELGLRQDRILLDRRRIAVLPAEAKIVTSGSGQQATFAAEGFMGVTIRPDHDAPVLSDGSGLKWWARQVKSPLYRFNATIEWSEGPPLTITVHFPSEAAIARWDGHILPANTRVTLAQLRDLVAVDVGAMELLATLKDPQTGQRAEMSWDFNRELPLSAIAADISSLLLPASIDASVLLDMHNGINTNWHVVPFALKLVREGSGFVTSEAIATEDMELCGRSFSDPFEEICFGSYSLLTEANHRPAKLPSEIVGTWLVYLRSGDTVMTRPTFYVGVETSELPKTALTRAMALPRHAVDAALRNFLSDATKEGDAGQAAVGELVVLCASLRGLPASAFLVFDLLCEYPAVLTRMAFDAAPSARSAVLSLSDSQPFMWATLPRDCWTLAMGSAFVRNLASLGSLSEAPRYAKEMVDIVRDAMIEREPLLAPVLGTPEDFGTIDAITQRFVNRGAIDRIRGTSFGRYRQIVGLNLPEYFDRFSDRCLDTFDAPCAAALAVKGDWQPDALAIRHIKTVARTFPTYFSEAFAACLQEHS